MWGCVGFLQIGGGTEEDHMILIQDYGLVGDPPHQVKIVSDDAGSEFAAVP